MEVVGDRKSTRRANLTIDRRQHLESMMTQFPQTRLRRLRQNRNVRGLVQDVSLSADDLMGVIFVKSGKGLKIPVPSMPGVYQLSPDQVSAEAEKMMEAGVKRVMLFGIPQEKDERGSAALGGDGVVPTAVGLIKASVPEMLVVSDLCFCEYTDHGHCGLLKKNKAGEYDVANDETLYLLKQQAITLAQAGVDVLAPSGSMDGMVRSIREALDVNAFEDCLILSYAVKYASNLYGPFRDAAEGTPQFGDRRGYQMDFARRDEALLEAQMDIEEGADMIMVKPASLYLDVISRVCTAYPEIPCAAYQVSGEYAMIKAAAEKGWLSEREVTLESLIALKRAGTSFIITYAAIDAARWIRELG